ncbi:hypothetical protein GCU67_20330 [Modestobacter muralis]|uniref:Uncharacterized protein n=1 Tax=Modestobacter muralis TaxID=1608614 RepID=A0A6P0EZA0_9ACTN|nr:hypothetical protein [Modestobacter muralis]NEK96497.1 hypothetical protein [Modestobacter muralis]NEN53397.1 hypothetical protein [Modestobacter muralis]
MDLGMAAAAVRPAGPVAAAAQRELSGELAMCRSPAPGRQSFLAGEERPAGDELDDEAECLEHSAGPLDGGQRDLDIGDQPVVGGAAVPSGGVVGVAGHAAGHGEHGVGLNVVGAADVAVTPKGGLDLGGPVRS